jgi:adenylyltransferase/sulfurtransferase
MTMPITGDDAQRYYRHLILPGFGEAGQECLRTSRVLVVGAGGLGSPAALYLAAAGVGTLGIADADAVELSNLQRQILHGTPQLGQAKVESARARLHGLNPGVAVIAIPQRITEANAQSMLADYDVVLDCTDNFPSRFLLNAACVRLGKPLVFGSVYHFEGQTTVFDARRGPCYRCLFPDLPSEAYMAERAQSGILGAVPGIIGAVQATETIKLLLGVGEPLIGRLLLLDALTMRFREVRLQRQPDCPLCV